MRLCYACDNGSPFIGLACADEWVDFTQVIKTHPDAFPWLRFRPQPTIADLLENTPNLLHAISEWWKRLEESWELEHVRLATQPQFLAPIPRPSKIIALGRNYRAHALESGHDIPDEPVLFAKAPSSVIGPGAAIVYPDGVKRLDPEIELGVVIGRKARFVSETEALDHVAGYTIVNDVTARDVQRRDQERKWPWFRSKSFDTFCPMGPYLVLRDQVPDPHNLELSLRVNGELRQHSTTSKMIFPIPHIIAFISNYMTLEPGDVIATGTPEGIAPLNRGDLVECTITGLGTLVNRVA